MNFKNMSNDEVRIIRRRESRHSAELNSVRILLSHNRGVSKNDPLLDVLHRLENEHEALASEAYSELVVNRKADA